MRLARISYTRTLDVDDYPIYIHLNIERHYFAILLNSVYGTADRRLADVVKCESRVLSTFVLSTTTWPQLTGL